MKSQQAKTKANEEAMFTENQRLLIQLALAKWVQQQHTSWEELHFSGSYSNFHDSGFLIDSLSMVLIQMFNLEGIQGLCQDSDDI